MDAFEIIEKIREQNFSYCEEVVRIIEEVGDLPVVMAASPVRLGFHVYTALQMGVKL